LLNRTITVGFVQTLWLNDRFHICKNIKAAGVHDKINLHFTVKKKTSALSSSTIVVVRIDAGGQARVFLQVIQTLKLQNMFISQK